MHQTLIRVSSLAYVPDGSGTPLFLVFGISQSCLLGQHIQQSKLCFFAEYLLGYVAGLEFMGYLGVERREGKTPWGDCKIRINLAPLTGIIMLSIFLLGKYDHGHYAGTIHNI